MGQVSTRSYTAREGGNTNLKSGTTNWGRSKELQKHNTTWV